MQFEGLFTLYRTNEVVYAEIKPNQFDQPLLAPIAIARGLAMAGQPLNFGDEWILVFRRVDDTVQLLRRNIHYEAPKGTPLEKAVQQNYTDSVLMALPIVSLSPGGGVLIDFSQIFLSDFAQLGLGEFDKSRSSWHKIKTFPNNLELEIEATYKGRGGWFRFGDDGVADARAASRWSSITASANCPSPATNPAMPTTGSGISSAPPRTSARPTPTRSLCGASIAGGWKKPIPRPSFRRPRSNWSGGSRTPCRMSTGPMSRRASWNGTRPSRRSASATP